MKIKDYKCKCGHNDFFFADKGNQKGIYCTYCGKWVKWADKDEQNLAMKQEPCEDAISRQAVLDLAVKIELPDSQTFFCISPEDVEALPPVTPQPKTGHWIYDNFNWRCSECNETPKTLGYVGTADFMTEHFKFCNHCGARMQEVDDDE